MDNLINWFSKREAFPSLENSLLAMIINAGIYPWPRRPTEKCRVSLEILFLS